MSKTRRIWHAFAALLLTSSPAVVCLPAQTLRLPDRSPGAVDDSERFAAAVAQLRGAAFDTLLIPPGQYRLAPTETRAHWRVDHLDSVVILGDNATLLMTSFDAPGIEIRDCQDVTVAGLTLDWDPLPWLAGRVVRVWERRTMVTLRLAEPLPARYADAFNRTEVRWATVWTEFGRRVLRTLDPIVIEDISVSGLEVTVSLPRSMPPRAAVKVGEVFLLVGRNARSHGFLVRNSTGVTIENNNIFSAPGMAIVGQDRNVDTKIRGNKIRPAPATRRFISTNADGIHLIGPVGRTVIEDNVVWSAQDDAIVVSQRGARVQISSGSTWFRLSKPAIVQMQSGDDVLALLPQGVVSLGRLREVVKEDGRRARFTTSCTTADVCPDLRFGFEFPVFFVPQSPSSVEIRGNLIYNIRGTGIRINTSHVLAERNVVLRTTGAQVMLGVMLRDRWVPQAGAVNVELRYNNFIEQTLPGEAERRKAAIDIQNQPRTSYLSGVPVNTDIRIHNNIFMLRGNHGLFATDAGVVTLSANRFRSTAVQSGEKAPAAVILEDVEQANVSDNTFFFAGRQNEKTTALLVRPVRTETELRLSGNQMYLNGTSQPRERIWQAGRRVRLVD